MSAWAAEPFMPSVHGCAFGNAETGGLPIMIGPLRLGAVAGGMCGGMVLDALRCWRRGVPPAGRSSAELTRVFAAQLRSFSLPDAPWRYLSLQRPAAAQARRAASLRARDELLDALRRGDPTPVALVCRLSRNPLALAAHHVVLAYRLTRSGADGATFAVYDPNHPGDDGVELFIGEDGVRHSHRRDVRAAFVLRAR